MDETREIFVERGKSELFGACDTGCCGLAGVVLGVVDSWGGVVEEGGSGGWLGEGG